MIGLRGCAGTDLHVQKLTNYHRAVYKIDTVQLRLSSSDTTDYIRMARLLSMGLLSSPRPKPQPSASQF